ncbi:CHY zinc finger protein [Natrinema salifodinae]|uniref:CHY zinc finger protein n=1 Tax=Natrinema salifodinae TaxID=1202768 RepID=UPI00067925A9|nr:CHY zinc finger protein [Natrinema salifodinae]
MQSIGSHDVVGVDVDSDTRCAHYRTERDVVAFRFACCERYYPCFRCHEERADHEAIPWPRERFDEPSVLCGVCGDEHTVPEYLAADYRCPACDAAFNPGCANHAELYFETSDSDT